MKTDVKEVLFSERQISDKVKVLGKKISEDYTDESLLMIGILKGANVFMSDLMREVNIPVEIDFIAASSYGSSTESSGVVKILKDLDASIEDKHVLIVEDIIDTGLTLNYLLNNLKTRAAKSIEVCTLLDKPERRKVEIDVKYKGFDIPDEFIVGYGIDYGEKYRNLPYIATLKEEIY
jgi:hypoxanthine phosphoribosyltransferase